jgi:uncharacterized membrane protein
LIEIIHMKTAFYLGCIIALLHSCDGGIADVASDTNRFRDTLSAKDSKVSVSFVDTLPSGAYQGIFPCKGCKGIQQTIFFNDDKSFLQEQKMLGKENAPKTGNGTWDYKAGTIELFQNNKAALSLIKKEDTLSIVAINHTSVTDPAKYTLTKRRLAGDNPVWNKKKLQGIDFAAIGNEPSWSLDIDNEKSVVFNIATLNKPVVLRAEKPLIGKDSILYTIKKDTILLTITIFPQFCNDSMSDYLYQYKVNIKYRGSLYKGCGIMFDKTKAR